MSNGNWKTEILHTLLFLLGVVIFCAFVLALIWYVGS